MKLEKEIFQKSFNNEYQKLAINILYTHGWLIDKLSKLIKKKNITLTQYNILRILRGQYPNYSSINLIKERMLDKTPDVSRLVDRLVEKKYIDRFKCKEDRRRINIIITKKGLRLLEKLDFVDDEIKNLFKNANEKEIKSANKILDKIRN